jgi:hypothetical protein
MATHDGLDNPRSEPEEDAFNRWPFSKRLADTIAEFDTNNGAPVIGIFGKWGYGKSTVLNYVKRELETTHSDKVVVFEFNPWLFTNEDELIAAFLIGLTSTLEKSLGNAWKEFGKLLEKGSGLFGMIPFIGSGAQKFTETVGKELAKDPLKSQRQRAVEIMRSATRTVVVLIDDLDRLDPQQVLTMLRLVRLNANFPRVVYVLAFDDGMVARAVGARYGDGTDAGRQFLEKIVQYPFTLPAVGLRRMIDYVRHAQEACHEAGVELNTEEWAKFQQLMDLHLSRRLNTPRHAIQYANALRFALPLLKGEVSPFVQILVEGLRVLFPEVYAQLRDDVRSFTVTTGKLLSAVDTTKLENVLRGVIKDSTEVNASREVVEAIFEPERPQSIGWRHYFDRSFTYALTADDISTRTMYEIVRDAYDSAELSSYLWRLGERGPERMLAAIYALVPHLDQARRLFLARAIAHSGSMFIADQMQLFSQTSGDRDPNPLANEAVKLIGKLARNPQVSSFRQAPCVRYWNLLNRLFSLSIFGVSFGNMILKTC